MPTSVQSIRAVVDIKLESPKMAHFETPRALVQSVDDTVVDVHKFLVLKAITQYVEHDFHKSVTSQPTQELPDDEFKNWRIFLNKLSYVCDFNAGGDTVAGLGAEAASERTVFWLATNCLNYKTRTTMQDHLCFVLSELDTPYNSLEDLAVVIRQRSIELSKDKVLNYRSMLARELERVKKGLRLATASEGTMAWHWDCKFIANHLLKNGHCISPLKLFFERQGKNLNAFALPRKISCLDIRPDSYEDIHNSQAVASKPYGII